MSPGEIQGFVLIVMFFLGASASITYFATEDEKNIYARICVLIFTALFSVPALVALWITGVMG